MRFARDPGREWQGLEPNALRSRPRTRMARNEISGGLLRVPLHPPGIMIALTPNP